MNDQSIQPAVHWLAIASVQTSFAISNVTQTIVQYLFYQEPMRAAKENETCTTCQVPSQSKFIAKYFPYKESEILLFEAVYVTHVITKQCESFLELSCTTEDSASIVNAFFS